MNTQKNNNGNRFSSQIIIILIIVGAFAAGWFMSARLAGPGMSGMPPGMMRPTGPTAVKVQTVCEDFTEQEKEYIAHVVPIQAVDLHPQVDGYLTEVYFKEGSRVHKGDLLFTIDPREYQALVDLRSAEFAQAKARMDRAKKYFKRLKSAAERSISQTDLDGATSDLQAAKAAVEMARASLELALIDLGYTRITAPISGRIGQAEIKTGNFVSSATQRLARIVQVNPVRVTFSPADHTYIKLLEEMNSGSESKINARVCLPGGIELEAAGRRDFVNNEMDLETGTIAMWLRFDNPDGFLIPGSYVKLFLGRMDRPRVLLVPQAAIVTDKNGDYVFVVDKNAKVEQRKIKQGEPLKGRVIIESGLEKGETIIVEGVQKVRPGITVNAVNSAADVTKGGLK